MTKYRVTYRIREDDPKDEIPFASYEVEANSMEEAKEQASVKFRIEYPETRSGEYEIDTQWETR